MWVAFYPLLNDSPDAVTEKSPHPPLPWKWTSSALPDQEARARSYPSSARWLSLPPHFSLSLVLPAGPSPLCFCPQRCPLQLLMLPLGLPGTPVSPSPILGRGRWEKPWPQSFFPPFPGSATSPATEMPGAALSCPDIFPRSASGRAPVSATFPLGMQLPARRAFQGSSEWLERWLPSVANRQPR